LNDESSENKFLVDTESQPDDAISRVLADVDEMRAAEFRPHHLGE
jgi:hypothetical protein